MGGIVLVALSALVVGASLSSLGVLAPTVATLAGAVAIAAYASIHDMSLTTALPLGIVFAIGLQLGYFGALLFSGRHDSSLSKRWHRPSRRRPS